jgi:hypothetical protein
MSSKTRKSPETLLRVSDRGVISLPKEMRKNVSFFEAFQREDGVIELRPKIAVDHSQGWFWTERWQQMEREADADIAAGRVYSYETDEAMLADLNSHRDSLKTRTRT